jgi:hypothetical protein
MAAPLERCAELLDVDLVTVRELAAKVEPYLRADGSRIWSLMQLERQLRPEAYGRRRGGYLDRRRTPATDIGTATARTTYRRRCCAPLGSDGMWTKHEPGVLLSGLIGMDEALGLGDWTSHVAVSDSWSASEVKRLPQLIHGLGDGCYASGAQCEIG